MKKQLVLGLLLSIPVISFSQTIDQKEAIQQKSNTEALSTLKFRLQSEENDKISKVEAYAEANNTPIDYVKDGVGYHMVDIVDNKPIYIKTYNVDSAKATKTDALNTGGDLGLDLDGLNMTVGVWDGGGIKSTHLEFKDASGSTSRVTIMDNSSTSGDNAGHATHVGGTIGSRGYIQEDSKGMAPQVNILSYNWTSDQSEVTSEAEDGLLISNHSYGLAAFDETDCDLNVSSWYLGCYSSESHNWDEIAYDAPYYLMVAAAGNDGYCSNPSPISGNGSGYDKLATSKVAKNNLVVANAQVTTNSQGTITNMYINSSSSQGPTDDYRIKPDITGDGTSVYSTYNSSNVSYATLTGTSMASPNVAGSLILLQEYYYSLHSEYMRSSTLKGLVCHTALDDDDKVGPDPNWGWGLLDTTAAAEAITADNDEEEAIISEITLNDGDTYTIQVSTDDPASLAATICWTDPAGESNNGSLNDDTPVLVNDLDLRISDDSETYLPYRLVVGAAFLEAEKGDNTVDNIEKVVVTSTETGTTTFTITVSHKNTLVNDNDVTNPLQEFSLIVTGSNLETLSNNKVSFSEIKVYPNPTSNQLNISLDKAYNNLNFKLVDINGRIIYNQTANSSVSNYQINTANLATGIYILQVENDTHSYTQKIIKN